MSKGMPKWQQRQMVVLCAILPVEQMIERSDVSREARRTWQRVQARAEKMQDPYNGFGEKPLRAMTNKIRDAIRHIEQEQVPLPAMTELCLYLAESVRMTLRGSGEAAKRDWELLCQSLFTLTKHIDPEWDEPRSPHQRQAVRLGTRFLEVVG